METPPYLIEQFAAERQVSPSMAKRVLYLQGLGLNGRTVRDAAKIMGVSTDTVKTVARKFLIDFADYRPYARRRDAGETVAPRAADIHQSATTLPLFGGLGRA